MNKLSRLAVLSACALSFAAPVSADDAHHGHAPSVKTTASSTALSDGEIKKVDKDAGKLTIKHGRIANLEMPGMTMIFRVKDRAMLDQVKPGDKIRFAAEKMNGALTVTKLEIAN
jgi:Cu(I)/Ag(I) efflux system periplasmic protein CusF